MGVVLNEKHCNLQFPFFFPFDVMGQMKTCDDTLGPHTAECCQKLFQKTIQGHHLQKCEHRYSLLDILPSSFNGLAEALLPRNWLASTDGWLPLASFNLRGDKNEKLEVEFGVGM